MDGIVSSEIERRIDFPGGGMIAVRSAHHPDNLRGEGLDLAVLDEAAFMEGRVWPGIIRPMLATSRGDALFLSTPAGHNWFRELTKTGLKPDWQDEWQSFFYPTASSPLIAPDELGSIQRMTPAHIWDAEYRAHFSADSGAVFRGIRAALATDDYPGPRQDRMYVAGIDWGRSHDYTAIAVIDVTARRMVALERISQESFSAQRDRLQRICAIWNPSQIWAESNSFGAPNIEALQEEGLPIRAFATTAKSKAPLIEALALAIESRRIVLLDDPLLLSELGSYTAKPVSGGGFRYGARPGCHDDTVMATALAWHGVSRSGPRFDFA